MANFVKVFEATSMQDGSGKVVRVGGKSIAVFRLGEEFFAMDNHCLHRGGPLSEGGIQDHSIVCPWHGWTYDLRTGSFKVIPALKVRTYQVKREGDSVLVDVSVGNISQRPR